MKSHIVSSKPKEAETPQEYRVFYTCDPEKNINCRKTECCINDGQCKLTKNLEFAKQPVETVTFAFPMSTEEFAELQKVDDNE